MAGGAEGAEREGRGVTQVLSYRSPPGESEIRKELVEAGQSEKVSEKMSEKLLWLMRDNPEISAKELAYTVNRSSRTIERAITKFKEEGRIKRIGPDKGGYWEVVECVE